MLLVVNGRFPLEQAIVVPFEAEFHVLNLLCLKCTIQVDGMLYMLTEAFIHYHIVLLSLLQ